MNFLVRISFHKRFFHRIDIVFLKKILKDFANSLNLSCEIIILCVITFSFFYCLFIHFCLKNIWEQFWMFLPYNYKKRKVHHVLINGYILLGDERWDERPLSLKQFHLSVFLSLSKCFLLNMSMLEKMVDEVSIRFLLDGW